VRPDRHTTRGVRALRSLVHSLDWEGRTHHLAELNPE
jgi:hypothetical protein